MMSLVILATLAFVATVLTTPACRAACGRFGWVDHPAPRKLHRIPVPRAGGIAIFLGYAGALVLMCGIFDDSPMRQAWTILPAVLVAFATGLLDDLVNLKPWMKIAGQALAALLASAAGIQIGSLGSWWGVPLTVVWLVGCSNAVNLIDGLDGLAAGIGLLATAAALLAALFTGNTLLAVVTAPLLGALLGFLPYNSNPASIFMGDCGSNTIGFLLGCYALLWTQKTANPIGIAAPVITLAIPILDTALTIFRRFVRCEPIFGADRGHIHHRLLARGFSPRRVACILYTAGIFFASLSILLTTGPYSGGPVLLALVVVIWLALRYLRYDEIDSIRRIFFGGVIRHALTADLSVRQLEAAFLSAETVDGCWLALQSRGQSLGLSRATMQVHGRTYAAEFPRGTSCECWSLRISLDGSGTIDLEIPFDPAPASVAPLANSIRSVLAPKLEALAPRLAFAAAAAGARSSVRSW